MTIYIDQMFNLGGAAVTALTSMNPSTATAAGSYAVLADGTLDKIVIQIVPQAATSLAQTGFITLNCQLWTTQQTLTIRFSGFGIATAPQLYGGRQAIQNWPPEGDGSLNLPVKQQAAIAGKIIYDGTAPVTPFATVTGIFH